MFNDPSITSLNVKPVDTRHIKSKAKENDHLVGIDDFNNLTKV